MIQIGNVPEINAVKNHFDALQSNGVVQAWELPYEHILTRLTAAIFFFSPRNEAQLDEIWTELGRHPMFTYRKNEEKKLSQLDWRVEFNKGFEI